MAGSQHSTCSHAATVQVLNKEIKHNVQQEGHLNQNVSLSTTQLQIPAAYMMRAQSGQSPCSTASTLLGPT